jgi:hypothetical protein
VQVYAHCSDRMKEMNWIVDNNYSKLMKDKLGITWLGGLKHSQEDLIGGQCDVHDLMSTGVPGSIIMDEV